jgi:hypothetical protein
MVPRAPLSHDYVLASPKFGARANWVLPAEDLDFRRSRRGDRNLVIPTNAIGRFCHALLFHPLEFVFADSDISWTTKLHRDGVAGESIPGDNRSGGCIAIGLRPRFAFETCVCPTPQMHAALIFDKFVMHERVVASVIDIHTASLEPISFLAVILDVVVRNN